MKKTILSALVAMFVTAILGVVVSDFTGIDPSKTVGFGVVGVFALSMFAPKFSNSLFTITYSPIEFTGPAYEEIFNEILYMNGTIEKGLVRLIDNINTETILTESNITKIEQAYVETPVGTESSGNLTMTDKILKPYSYMMYQRFSPKDFVMSRFGKPNGGNTAFPKITDEFIRFVVERFGKSEAEKMEARFWNGATTATKAAIAALTAGTANNEVSTAEKAYVAAAPSTLIDGILTKLIGTYAATKARIKVAGTTITTANIAAEYAKVYAAMLPQLLQPNYADEVVMFVPHNNLQIINATNAAALYRDVFNVANGTYTYAGVKLEFVPLPNNAIIAGKKMDLVWGCDITAPDTFLKVDYIAADSEQMFIKGPYTQESAFVQAQQFVVYVG